MTPQDAALTDREPLWQTSWASEYLANEDYEKYEARVGDELIALAAYTISLYQTCPGLYSWSFSIVSL